MSTHSEAQCQIKPFLSQAIGDKVGCRWRWVEDQRYPCSYGMNAFWMVQN